MTKLLLTVVAFLFLVCPAQATVFCEVLKTPDGFVALRAAPSVKGKLLHKLRAGDEVQVGLGKKGAWDKVILYLSKNKDTAGKTVTGWVNSRFLSDVCG
jgi:hypothetical protein